MTAGWINSSSFVSSLKTKRAFSGWRSILGAIFSRNFCNAEVSRATWYSVALPLSCLTMVSICATCSGDKVHGPASPFGESANCSTSELLMICLAFSAWAETSMISGGDSFTTSGTIPSSRFCRGGYKLAMVAGISKA